MRAAVVVGFRHTKLCYHSVSVNTSAVSLLVILICFYVFEIKHFHRKESYRKTCINMYMSSFRGRAYKWHKHTELQSSFLLYANQISDHKMCTKKTKKAVFGCNLVCTNLL